jgi:hypothetical protein
MMGGVETDQVAQESPAFRLVQREFGYLGATIASII